MSAPTTRAERQEREKIERARTEAYRSGLSPAAGEERYRKRKAEKYHQKKNNMAVVGSSESIE